jgi:hypothetical protein
MKAARDKLSFAAFLLICVTVSLVAVPVDKPEQPDSGKWRFRVAQRIDTPFTQLLTEKSGRLLDVDVVLELDSLVATNEKSKLELVADGGEILRLGSQAVAVIAAPRTLRMKAGSALLHLPPQSSPIAYSTPMSQVKLAGSGTLLLEVTGNGGFKAIGLSGAPEIVLLDGTKRIVRPGNLTFVLENPGKFGPILDVDLLTLISTSNLVSGFEKPISCNADLMQSMMLQRTRIRQRTRSFVGDAKDNQGFQLLDVGNDKK